MLQSIRQISPVARAILVIGVVAALVTSITFAALQSQATLTNNSISSATAELQVDNIDNGAGFGATDLGYDFVGIVPGGAGSNVGNFQLKNNGSAPLSVSVEVPVDPVFTVLPSGSVDPAKVDVVIQRGAGTPQVFALSDLLAGPVTITGGNIAAGATENFNVQVLMDADAFTGTSASSDDFTFTFTGTGV